MESLGEEEIEETELMGAYVVPFLSAGPEPKVIAMGDGFQYRGVDFKIIASFPPRGTFAQTTTILFDGKVSCTAILEHITLVPAAASIDSDARMDRDAVTEDLRHHATHIVEGSLIQSRGLHLSVTQCFPASGLMDDSTLIDISDPAPDLTQVHILPVLDTLPAADRHIDEADLVERYLKPYLQGTFRLLTVDTTLVIQGVTFLVLGARPQSGFVTANTVVYANGDYVSAEEMDRRRQRLQEVEAQRVREEAMQREMDRGVSMVEERIRALLQHIPEQHPQRRAVEALLMQLQGQPRGLFGHQFLQMMMNPRLDSEEEYHRAAQRFEIDQLPTMIYDSSTVPESMQADNEWNTCRVCLSEYEDGDHLRTLPCFHKYHKDCIDQWLSRENKCPICKHRISE